MSFWLLLCAFIQKLSFILSVLQLITCLALIVVYPILQYETNKTQLICETDCLTKTDNKLRYTIIREMTCYIHVLNQGLLYKMGALLETKINTKIYDTQW